MTRVSETKSSSPPIEKKKGRTSRKTPYTKFREAAKTKRANGTVQVRLGVMVIGILLAMLVYFYPRFHSSFNESVTTKSKWLEITT